MGRRLRTIGTILVCVVLALTLLLTTWQPNSLHLSQPQAADSDLIDSLLFFPSKYPSGDWDPPGLRYDDVWLQSADGTRLHGWYCPAEDPRATVLIAHGNAGHLAARAEWLRYLQTELRLSVFMFDYRGYGRSEGKPSVRGATEDTRAARAKLREIAGIDDSEMVLMGESVGGAFIVQSAAESAPRALVLQSTFSSLRAVADVHYPMLAWVVPKDKLDSAAAIGDYRGPLLQSHGTADEIVPLKIGQRLFRAANEPKTFVRIPGAGHNDWLRQDYFDALDRFIAGLE